MAIVFGHLALGQKRGSHEVREYFHEHLLTLGYRIAAWRNRDQVSMGTATAAGARCRPALIPRLIASERVTASFLGRIDNASILAQSQHLPNDAPLDDVLSAEVDSGSSRAFGRLLGDWCLAVFHHQHERLQLGGDYMTLQPLYYAANSREVWWASDLRLLATGVIAPLDLDLAYVAAMAAGTPPPARTPFRAIQLLAPATVVTIDAEGGVRQERVWTPPEDAITHADPREYAERLRALMREAVAVRLTLPQPAWCSLSGGFDSSSVACFADEAIRNRTASATRLEAATFCSGMSPEWAETPFVNAVEAACGLQTHYVDLDRYPALPPAVHATPETARWEERQIARLMESDGASTLLSGRMGDTVMGQLPYDIGQPGEYLRTWELTRFCRGVRAWALGRRSTIYKVAWDSCRFLLPYAYQTRLDSAEALRLHSATRKSVRTAQLANLFLTPRALELAEEAIPPLTTLIARRPPGTSRRLTLAVARYFAYQRLRPYAGMNDVRFTYPYAHRPLLEYALRIPSRVLYGPGAPRALMKEAVAGILPERVLQRRSKGFAGGVAMRLYRPVALRLLQSDEPLLLVEAGIVDRERLLQAARDLINGKAGGAGNIPTIAQTEDWMRCHAGRAGLMPAQPSARSPVSRISAAVV